MIGKVICSPDLSSPGSVFSGRGIILHLHAFPYLGKSFDGRGGEDFGAIKFVHSTAGLRQGQGSQFGAVEEI